MELTENTVEIKWLNLKDYEDLIKVMNKAYSAPPGGHWDKAQIKKLISIFPEGQLAVFVNDQIAGCALSIIVESHKFKDSHTYAQITGNETFSTHSENGDILYGIDVFILPEERGKLLGRRLYDARKDLCEQLNLKAIVFGGRIPNYHEYAAQLTPKEYILKVKNKEIEDPILNFQLNNDFQVKRVLRNYLPGDKESGNFAVLLQWNNIYYQEEATEHKLDHSTVRIGLVQWQMRLYKNLDEVFDQVEYFVKTLSGYKSDFALFPEYFNAPLMAQFNEENEADAIRGLAQYTDEIVAHFSQLATKYNVNLITGSMPEMRENDLYNVGFLCHRDGRIDRYEKLHVTPDEERAWGLKGGDLLRTYDTDCGKIGILICYDVEFPELPRILALEGMDILFVPFLTDTQNGYSRVRYCAQSRAIENECYVAIAGSVGNLPKVQNMDIQYAQSMVFTPSDFQFPANGIKAEATPNTEMIVVCDLDMNMLTELNNYGAVRNLKDRRTDLYKLSRTKQK